MEIGLTTIQKIETGGIQRHVRTLLGTEKISILFVRIGILVVRHCETLYSKAP